MSRGRARVALTTLASLVISLAAVEVGFRVHARLAPPPRWITIDRYPGNPRGYFRDCGFGEFCPDLDRLPMHGCDAPVVPGKGQVVFVGDSFTWGQGVDAVDAWPSLIKFPRDQRRNCAVSGHEIWHVQEDVKNLVEKYHPRLVVYGMVLNDFGLLVSQENDFVSVGGASQIADYMNFRTMNLDDYLRTRRHSTAMRWLLDVSETARWIYRAQVLRRVSRLTLDGYRASFAGETGAEGYARIRDMAARSGERFLVVLWPLMLDFDHYPLEDVHRAIRAQLERDHIHVLDLLDAFRGRDASKLIVFPTDQHPNEEAHRIAARAVRDELERLKWPPYDAP